VGNLDRPRTGPAQHRYEKVTMSQRSKKDQKPGVATEYADVIAGISGEVSTFSPVGELYERILRARAVTRGFYLPMILGLEFQRDAEDLNTSKRMLGAAFAEFDNDPAVIVVRRLQNPSDDSFPATYRVIGGLDGNTDMATVYPSSSPVVIASDRFIIQQVSEVDEERLGPMYTFAQPLVYGVGRAGRIFTYGGWLVDNLKDGSAQAQWMEMYDRWLRGSKCIQNKCFAEIYYRDKIRRGYIMHTNLTEDASQPSRAQFAFTIFVVDELTISFSRIKRPEPVAQPGPAQQELQRSDRAQTRLIPPTEWQEVKEQEGITVWKTKGGARTTMLK